MSIKKNNRLRRAKRGRMLLRECKLPRLSVFRSGKHIYAQVITADGGKILASASTVEKELRAKKTHKGLEGAKIVGSLIAVRTIKKKIETVGFDRSGFKYHGCVKALAESARENGLKF